MTIGLSHAAELVRQYPSHNIDQRCVDNLHMLMELRDNAVHLQNATVSLSKRLQEVGSAALKNFARAVTSWFGVDLSRFNFYLMPLAFHAPTAMMESLTHGHQPEAVRKLLQYIADKEREHPSDETKDFNVTLQVELRFIRTAGIAAAPVRVARGPDAVRVEMAEEDVRRNFPWEYNTLREELKKKYPNFRQDKRFYDLKAELERDQRLCHVRYLDPAKPNGSQKKFYSRNIIAAFDPHYNQV
jgi:hypothetical protein